MKNILLILIAITLILPMSAHAAVYEIDPVHSDFGFAVKHMVITKVVGTFKKIEGQMEFDENNKLTSANALIAAESIYTKIEKRDNHLRSPDFFDVAKFPTITFKSTSIDHSVPGKLTITGNITIRDVTKEITLAAETLGPIKDPWGGTRMGISATGTLNRKDFGLTWNKVLESGGLVVDDTIELNIEGQGILKK